MTGSQAQGGDAENDVEALSTPPPMPSAFEPKGVEAEWSARWDQARLFVADPASPRPKYSIAVPPPNVTGELHMGHATNATLQDIWARHHRMTGHEVLWLPGTDHAAIATQNVIERQLAREGTSKEEIGRPAFDELVQDWYERVGRAIISQFRDLGASLDFTRLRFTMDEDYARAVRAAFVHYFERGWLYRGPRIVNWCPTCMSAISDLEVEWIEREDILYHLAYDLEGGGQVVIATVRPETILADTAIAVNPEDARFQSLVGRTALLPLVGRRLPIIADAAVEIGFGSGALKVTPGHDPLDWEIGMRHGLDVVTCILPNGLLQAPGLPYDGLTVAAGREAIVADLDAQGRVLKREPYLHQVGHCDRTKDVIEPQISEQWFLRMGELAARCLEASRRGEVRWHPARFEKTYLDWLGGIRDWCVSRQLWLGHRIPVYTCANGHVFAAVEEPSECAICASPNLEADKDVLDTWFSSALWPFATLGWPDQTADLLSFYPTGLIVTARDILNLWVTRMIFSGLELTGEVPFSDVIVHATIQAADGRRMSKSLGTGIDPRQIIDRYGADALRAWAAQVGMSAQDVRFDESRIEGFRRFANKMWNATRLVLGALGSSAPPPLEAGAALTMSDRWILSRLQDTTTAVDQGIAEYAAGSAIGAIYDFAWHDFCDWYLEGSKARLREGEDAARSVSLQVLDVVLRLLHPFMPFVSEDLWHRLPGERDFLVHSQWPRADSSWHDEVAERAMARLIALVDEIRRARQAAHASARGGLLRVRAGIEQELLPVVADLARVRLVGSIDGPLTELTEASAQVQFPSQTRTPGLEEAELGRLRDEMAKISARLDNPEFVVKAPPPVVDRQRARMAELRDAIERLTTR
ncbi:MAG TPA: valine--tRNA ligase [Candidatus Acidoferrales bacterium]|nr:valine--tRNA ligase [Candidatus Acidoferrales bacterium]